MTLPAGAKRYVAIRAVDEQGNVGAAARHRAPKPTSRGHGHSVHSTSHSSSAFWAWRRFSAWSQMRWRGP